MASLRIYHMFQVSPALITVNVEADPDALSRLLADRLDILCRRLHRVGCSPPHRVPTAHPTRSEARQ
jgi:hypothetical protein